MNAVLKRHVALFSPSSPPDPFPPPAPCSLPSCPSQKLSSQSFHQLALMTASSNRNLRIMSKLFQLSTINSPAKALATLSLAPTTDSSDGCWLAEPLLSPDSKFFTSCKPRWTSSQSPSFNPVTSWLGSSSTPSTSSPSRRSSAPPSPWARSPPSMFNLYLSSTTKQENALIPI